MIRIPQGDFAFTRSADAKAWTLRDPLPGTLRSALPVLKWEKEDMERLGLPTDAEGESRPDTKDRERESMQERFPARKSMRPGYD